MSRFRALIFDMDGTLTKPAIDFHAIRRETGILSGDLMEEIGKLPPERGKTAWAIVEAHEERAMQEQELQDGAESLLAKCRENSIKVGVVTRNAKRSVDSLCRKYGLQFDAVIGREFGFVKPDPMPVLHILKEWRIAPECALTIGDYVYDLESGRGAGTQTCFYQNPNMPSYADKADFSVNSMDELSGIIFRRLAEPAANGVCPCA